MRDEPVTIRTAAMRADMSSKTLERWVRQGKVPHTLGEEVHRGNPIKLVRLSDVLAVKADPGKRITPRAPRPPATSKPCRVGGCDRPVLTRGWCRYHYDRNRRTGDPLTPTIDGADVEAEFLHLASLLGQGQAIDRLAGVFGVTTDYIRFLLRDAGWSVWADHVGRVRVTAERGELKVKENNE